MVMDYTSLTVTGLIFYFNGFTSTAVQPMRGIEGLRYRASGGLGSVIHYHTLFVRDFAAMGSSSFNPHAHFLVQSAE